MAFDSIFSSVTTSLRKALEMALISSDDLYVLVMRFISLLK